MSHLKATVPTLCGCGERPELGYEPGAGMFSLLCPKVGLRECVTVTAAEKRAEARPRHDCSIRLWNLESKTCIQEFTAHRKKFDESIHDVAFHPTKCYIASAGADALAKVFV
ncbi:hypothetical protein SKAU_G00147850 [Synaphobranchus kaupii]|uniref:Uncharacterized protein n=1 Tax=Synaphobranchus kaupii TaxID=118154 RepID=A0A9Q1FTX7_SYNKA|nr:hypothetical protein SKAU_G00147850 [Synaphobranchus kaupii]